MNQTDLIIDMFAGGGGASSGLEAAAGRPIDIAVNHSPQAISMHTVNHPKTQHHCEDVWEVDPIEATQGKDVLFMWFSPSCTHHSKARGGKPMKKQLRGQAWLVNKWCRAKRPKVLTLENVQEFKTWGPLDKQGRVIKSRKGEFFNEWVADLESLGYVVEHRELTACDYGAPTSRKRLFVIARCDGFPIVWPEATHHKGSYVSARECIDWQIPSPSIFTRKKPLAENTLRRIVVGGFKYCLPDADPYIVRIGHTGHGGNNKSYSIDDPLTTIVGKNEHILIEPKFAEWDLLGKTPSFLLKYYGNSVGQDLSDPLDTITGRDRFAKVDFVTKSAKLTEDERYRAWHIARMFEHYNEDHAEPLLPGPRPAAIGNATGPLIDLGLRMLSPRELFDCQGFDSSYIIDRGADGEKLTKKTQVLMVGNSVPPPFSEAIFGSNVNDFYELEQAA